MNGNGRMTAQLSVGVSSELKRKLQILARRQHRTLAGAVRVLLEEAMELEESLAPTDPKREEFEMNLTMTQAARLVRRGYNLQVWEPTPTQLPLL